MRKLLACLTLVIGASAGIYAQATPTSKWAWTQDAPTLADAQAYTYRYYADGATTGVALTGVTCTGTVSPFACEANIPAFTPGNHVATLTAGNIAGESAKSSPLNFVFVVTPASPSNFRIK